MLNNCKKCYSLLTFQDELSIFPGYLQNSLVKMYKQTILQEQNIGFQNPTALFSSLLPCSQNFICSVKTQPWRKSKDLFRPSRCILPTTSKPLSQHIRAGQFCPSFLNELLIMVQIWLWVNIWIQPCLNLLTYLYFKNIKQNYVIE